MRHLVTTSFALLLVNLPACDAPASRNVIPVEAPDIEEAMIVDQDETSPAPAEAAARSATMPEGSLLEEPPPSSVAIDLADHPITVEIPAPQPIQVEDELSIDFSLVLPEPRMRVGAVDGADAEVIGLINDLAVDADGNIYVADEHGQNIRRYSPSGDLLDIIGREGSGPGEFRFMRRIHVDRDAQLLYTLNSGNLRMSVFEIGGGEPVLREETPIPAMTTTDFCLLGDRLYLAGLRDNRIIHEMDPAGDVMRSFGTVPTAGEDEDGGALLRSVVASMALGDLVCSEAAGLLVFVAANRPEVRAFTPDRALVWRTEIENFATAEVTRLPNGGVQFGMNSAAGGNHSVLSVALLNRENVVVQVGFGNLQVRAYEGEIVSRIYDLATGREVARRTDLPLISYVQGGTAWGYHNHPFPHFLTMDVSATAP